MEYVFTGKWITDREFARLMPRDVFHRQLDRDEAPLTDAFYQAFYDA